MTNPENEKGPETKLEFSEQERQQQAAKEAQALKQELAKTQETLEQLKNVPEGSELHQQMKAKAHEISQQREAENQPGAPEDDFIKAIDNRREQEKGKLADLEQKAADRNLNLVQEKTSPDFKQEKVVQPEVQEPSQQEAPANQKESEAEAQIPQATEVDGPEAPESVKEEPNQESKTFKSAQAAAQESEDIIAGSRESLEAKEQELAELRQRVSQLETETADLKKETDLRLQEAALKLVRSVPDLRICYKRSSKGGVWESRYLKAAKIIHEVVKDGSLKEAILGLKDLAKGVKTQYRREFGIKLKTEKLKEPRKVKTRKLRKQEPIEASA